MKSLGLMVLGLFLWVCPVFDGHNLGHASFWESNMPIVGHLCTKFEVINVSGFGVMFEGMPKNLRVT